MKKKFGYYLEETIGEAIKLEADRLGISINELVESIFNTYLTAGKGDLLSHIALSRLLHALDSESVQKAIFDHLRL